MKLQHTLLFVCVGIAFLLTGFVAGRKSILERRSIIPASTVDAAKAHPDSTQAPTPKGHDDSWGFLELNSAWVAYLAPGECPTKIILRRPADTFITASQAGHRERHLPILLIMCEDGHASVSILNGCPPRLQEGFDSSRVGIAIDDAPLHSEVWQQSLDHHALLAPNPASFAQTLLHSKRLRYQFTPLDATTQTTTFSLAPLPDEIMVKLVDKLGGDHGVPVR